MNDFQKTMLDLAEGRLTPEEWNAWWDAHHDEVKAILSPGAYLRLKPRPYGGFRWHPIFASQYEAFCYLESNGIAFERAIIYQENNVKEQDDYHKEWKRKEKECFAALQARCPQLFERYPKFCKSLKNKFMPDDRIEAGVMEEAFQRIACDLPDDIKTFFRTVSVISIDGISIDFNWLRTEILLGEEYLVLGEFWKDADGDLLLIKQCEAALPTAIYYYFHSANKVKKLCASIDDLMEKKFSWYNRQ
jgi:hypothetical protein